MKKSVIILVISALLVLCSQTCKAQKMIKIEADSVFILQEAMVVIAEKNDALEVQMVLPAFGMPEGYEDIDLKTFDKILMINRKRIKTLEELKKIYNELDTGETVKLGIKRDEETFIVSFPKIDPEKLPKTGLIIKERGEGEEKSPESRTVIKRIIKEEKKSKQDTLRL